MEEDERLAERIKERFSRSGHQFSQDTSFLNEDEYYLFYEMMVMALKTDNVAEGINKSLYLLMLCLSSGHIILHKKDENGFYSDYISDASMKSSSGITSNLIDKVKDLVEKKGMLHLTLNVSEDLKNMKLIHIKTELNEYMLSITNYDDTKNYSDSFWNSLCDTMCIILKRADSYYRNVVAINTDLLTGLDNRNSYEKRVQSFIESDDDLIFGIFDLFRLKHINDYYSHVHGDNYIKKAASIINKYWPKETKSYGLSEKRITDTCVYRVGGDEFVLMTNAEDLELANIKASLAAEEVSYLDVGLGEDVPLGLNFGIVRHTPGDSLKETYQRADAILAEDKTKMYRKYNLERRH